MLSTKDMFLNKDYYALEPAKAQIYTALTMSPWTAKIIWGLIIDARLVSKRKYYLIFFGITSIISQFAIGFGENRINED